MLQDLFKIEFATLDSQSIMYGYANGNSVAIASGTTDSVATPSGSAVSNTDGKHAMKYRGIENWYGNVYQWCDGANFQARKPYVCENPKSYASDVFTGAYHGIGYATAAANGNNRIVALGYDANNPFAQFPTDLTGSDTTYYCDYGYMSTGTANYVVRVSGYWNFTASVGAWFFYSLSSSTAADTSIGGRLLKRPL